MTAAATRLLDALCRGLAVAGGAVMVAASLVTGASVLGRYFLARPIPGDGEIAALAIAASISLCMPWCAWRRGHVVVDVATTRLSPRAQAALDAVGLLLLAAVAALLAWRMAVGGVEMRAFGDESMVLRIPSWIGFAVGVPCFAVTAVAALAAAFRREAA